MDQIIPSLKYIVFEKITKSENEIIIYASTMRKEVECPKCHLPTQKIHSYYTRHPQDLPITGKPVRVQLHTRKFFCMNSNCTARVFCERLPESLEKYAHRTVRLNQALTAIALAVGGELGSRLAPKLGYTISSATLIKRIRGNTINTSSAPTVKVLGIDDFAFRKGRSYGTILVDQERRKPIDLLPDRESSTLAEWLKHHPEVEIVTRDRAQAYAEGVRTGAPNAIQVADRWHILKNLSEALEKLLIRKRDLFSKATNPSIEGLNTFQQIQYDLESEITDQKPGSQQFFSGRVREEVIERRKQKAALWNEVIKLKNKGISIPEIARRTGKSERTVSRWVKQGEYHDQVRHDKNRLDSYFSYIAKRWNEGCKNVMQLWRELNDQGYSGSYSCVWRYLQRQDYLYRKAISSSEVSNQGIRAARRTQIESLIPISSPKQMLWMLLKPEKLNKSEREVVNRLTTLSPEISKAIELATDFHHLMKEKKVDCLSKWIVDAKNSNIDELKSFARRLEEDRPEIEAAITYHWSNGQVEGQVNRLKMIKRTMYGRAKIDLLRARVLNRI